MNNFPKNQYRVRCNNQRRRAPFPFPVPPDFPLMPINIHRNGDRLLPHSAKQPDPELPDIFRCFKSKHSLRIGREKKPPAQPSHHRHVVSRTSFLSFNIWNSASSKRDSKSNEVFHLSHLFPSFQKSRTHGGKAFPQNHLHLRQCRHFPPLPPYSREAAEHPSAPRLKGQFINRTFLKPRQGIFNSLSNAARRYPAPGPPSKFR